jgi:Fur family ferric uptake transcriptional regulator
VRQLSSERALRLSAQACASESALRYSVTVVARAKPTALETHAAIIRGAGLRVTQPRLAVIRILERTARPLSHADLIEALDGQGFDRVTLYRNLNDLAEAGLVLRTEVGDRVWRFELLVEADGHQAAHPHFTCTDCGTVACLPDGTIRIGKNVKLPRAVREHSVEVSLRGVCDRCS